MENTNIKPHTLCIKEGKSIVIEGIKQVVAVTEKEIEVKLSEGGLTVKGRDITADKLDVKEGTLVASCSTISQVNYTTGKKQSVNLKNLFK